MVGWTPPGAGPLGGCADITALPLLEGVPNVTFLGLGCRLKAAMDPCHLMRRPGGDPEGGVRPPPGHGQAHRHAEKFPGRTGVSWQLAVSSEQ